MKERHNSNNQQGKSAIPSTIVWCKANHNNNAKKMTSNTTRPKITNPLIYKFPEAEQRLDRITQVEQFTQEEREQFCMCEIYQFL